MWQWVRQRFSRESENNYLPLSSQNRTTDQSDETTDDKSPNCPNQRIGSINSINSSGSYSSDSGTARESGSVISASLDPAENLAAIPTTTTTSGNLHNSTSGVSSINAAVIGTANSAASAAMSSTSAPQRSLRWIKQLSGSWAVADSSNDPLTAATNTATTSPVVAATTSTAAVTTTANASSVVGFSAVRISFGCIMEATDDSTSTNEAIKMSSELCPICCELRSDVQVLPHWQPRGDISQHKMCSSCRLQHAAAHECPFCKELLHQNEFICVMHDFVNDLTAAAAATADPHAAAVLFEQWQALEMQFEGNQRIIGQLAMLVIEHDGFVSLLSEAVQQQQHQLQQQQQQQQQQQRPSRQRKLRIRNVAGVVFRFWGLLKDGCLPHCHHVYEELINSAVDAVLTPLEQSFEAQQQQPQQQQQQPQQPQPLMLSGDTCALLLVQSLAAFLCATKSGFPTQKLRLLVRRVGSAVVRCYRCCDSPLRMKQAIASSVLLQCLKATQEAVWGSSEDDIVTAAFFD